MAIEKEDYGTERASEQTHCALPEVSRRALDPNIDPFRESLIRIDDKKWMNGTVLHYYFFDRGSDGDWVGPDNQRQAVRDAFEHWKELGIGLAFAEVAEREEAEVRIGFLIGGGSWSYVGRDVVDLVPDANRRTMNFGWSLTTDWGRDTALHEIGHTLGMPHEHQNPNSGIVWDEEAVYDRFGGPPNNWDRDKVDWNILRKLDPASVEGSAWDPDSIMHYAFGPDLIVSPARYQAGLAPEPDLSEMDKTWVKQFYPPLEAAEEQLLEPFVARRLTIGAGAQVDFRIRPSFSRRYTIQTFGQSDVVMVLFEERDGQPRFLAGDDDSGYDTNARLELRLERGREYILRLRLYYEQRSGETAVFMW